MQRVGVSVLRQRARALVENESEQFPVASAVPVAPQWGEQRGNTTGTPIGKHNGEKNGKQQRKMKSEKKIHFLFYLIALKSCLYINRRTQIFEIFFVNRKSQIFEIFF